MSYLGKQNSDPLIWQRVVAMHSPLLREIWLRLATIDGRSLASFRVGLGLLLMVDAIRRISSVEAHYTDLGMLPRALILGHPDWWSLYSLSAYPGLPVLLFVIFFVAALCFMIGFNTRLSGLILWILVVSLHNRNPHILQGGDILVRLSLFWCLFLPLGSYYSIDAIHRYGEEDPKRLGPVVSIASFGLLVQSAAVYLFTALEKRGASWLEGSAVRDALLIDHYQSVFGGWLVQVAPDWILSSANYGVLIFEHLIFFLLFLPIGSFKARVITVSLLWLMHLGFALSLDIGQFPWVCMVSSILFYPPVFGRL